MEAWHIVRSGLVEDGTVNDVSPSAAFELQFMLRQILYGVPVGVNKIPDLAHLSDEIRPFKAELRLMVDNLAQLRALEAFDASNPRVARWSVFVKVDQGMKYVISYAHHWCSQVDPYLRRSGLTPASQGMTQFLTAVLASSSISVYGFYCHSGNAYASKSVTEGSSYLSEELNAVNSVAAEALALLAETPNAHQQPFVLSVGSTPSTHAASFSEVRAELKRVLNGTLELHAGKLLRLLSVSRRRLSS